MNNKVDVSNCTNLTVSAASAYLYGDFQYYFVYFIVPSISLFGILTNSAFLYVIYRVPNMRTATNFYLANLAVSDGVLLIVSTTNYLWTYIESSINYGYPFNSAGCAVSLWVIYVFSFASVAFLTLVALERYQAVCRPIQYRQRNVSSNPLYNNIKYTAITWTVLVVVVAAPISDVHVMYTCVLWPSQEPFLSYPSVIHKCLWPNWTWIFLCSCDICEFSMALLINIVVYIQIVKELSKRRGGEKGKATVARNNVARKLCVNAVVFFLCLFPIQLSNVAEIHQFVHKTSQPFYASSVDNVLLWIGRVAFLINSSVNPIIYNISNPEYRKAFQKAMPCIFPTSNNPHRYTSTSRSTADTIEGETV